MLKYEEKINVYENTSQITESGIHYDLGISDWNQKLKSYGKTLHNNSSFAYDSEGIYLNDKIEISFSSDENYSVQKKENIKIGNVILTKEKGKEKHFHHQFKITVEDFSFGYINFHSTANDSIHKIEISNECLYVKNGMFILDTLYKIASHFTFKFSNICDYELARDTERNYYAELSNIHLQSNRCQKQIYNIYGGKPLYTFFGKRKEIHQSTDSSNTEYGTYKIGNRNSDTQLKIYVKSHELKKWKEKKNYISEIHNRYFKNAKEICRTEVIANSKAFRKRNLELIDLLIPEKHPKIFQSLLGQKLKFTDLRTKYWDKNKNKKYKSFELIDPVFFDQYGVEKIPIKLKTTSNNQYNKFKQNVHEFLDDEHTIYGIISFFKCNIWNQSLGQIKYEKELNRAINNYTHQLNKKKKKKVEVLINLLESKGNYWKILISYINYRM